MKGAVSVVFSILLVLLILECGYDIQAVRGRALGDCYEALEAHSVPIELVIAVLTQEDGNYFKHRGIDWRAVWYSFRENLARGEIVFGASTINMQVASLCYAEQMPENKLWAKFRESVIGVLLERRYYKGQLLEAYLGAAPLIPESNLCARRGFPAAGRYYYGKELRRLTVPEIWSLVLTLRSKESLNPLSRKRGLSLPPRVARQHEWSKRRAKRFRRRYGVEIARFPFVAK